MKKKTPGGRLRYIGGIFGSDGTAETPIQGDRDSRTAVREGRSASHDLVLVFAGRPIYFAKR